MGGSGDDLRCFVEFRFCRGRGGHRFMKVFHKKTVFFEGWLPLTGKAGGFDFLQLLYIIYFWGQFGPTAMSGGFHFLQLLYIIYSFSTIIIYHMFWRPIWPNWKARWVSFSTIFPHTTFDIGKGKRISVTIHRSKGYFYTYPDFWGELFHIPGFVCLKVCHAEETSYP